MSPTDATSTASDAPAEDVTLTVGDSTYPGRVNSPDADATDETGTCAGILVLPGAGHGPFGDVFDRFAQTAADDGFTVARFETWEDREALDQKTTSDHAAEIRAGVDHLQERGCDIVHVVAKSYCGRLALDHVPEVAGEDVDRMVLWAPAVIFGEHPEAPTVDAADLEHVAIPTRILQGDEDNIPVENAASIADHLPNGDLVELPGEDHSFQHDQERIVRETLDFLNS